MWSSFNAPDCSLLIVVEKEHTEVCRYLLKMVLILMPEMMREAIGKAARMSDGINEKQLKTKGDSMDLRLILKRQNKLSWTGQKNLTCEIMQNVRFILSVVLVALVVSAMENTQEDERAFFETGRT